MEMAGQQLFSAFKKEILLKVPSSAGGSSPLMAKGAHPCHSAVSAFILQSLNVTASKSWRALSAPLQPRPHIRFCRLSHLTFPLIAAGKAKRTQPQSRCPLASLGSGSWC